MCIISSDLCAQKSSPHDIVYRPWNGEAILHIPKQVLEQKLKDGTYIHSDACSNLYNTGVLTLTAHGMVPVVSIAHNTIHNFLPDTINQ